MADKVDITIEQGATWWYEITLTEDDGSAMDLTGYRCDMWLKRNYRQDEADLELSSTTNEITITPGTGVITFELDEENTELLNGQYIYDIKLTSGGGDVIRLLQGNVYTSPQVTE